MALMQNGKNGYLAEINVTPFVDVMLVLLIIFMVTAPLMTQGVDVELPETKTVKSLPEESDHLVLSIQKDGKMYLDKYEVTFEDLGNHLSRLVASQKKLLFLRADKDVPYGIVVRAMGEIKGAGIDKLGVVAEPEGMSAGMPVVQPSSALPGRKAAGTAQAPAAEGGLNQPTTDKQ